MSELRDSLSTDIDNIIALAKEICILRKFDDLQMNTSDHCRYNAKKGNFELGKSRAKTLQPSVIPHKIRRLDSNY